MSKYSKETAEVIIKNVPQLNGWLKDENLRIDEMGVWIEPFLDHEGNSFLTTDESNALEWKACCELDGPNEPDPRTAPALSIPFSEMELAAFMLDGVGGFLQEVYGSLQMGPDESVLKTFPVVDKKAKEALIGAYAAFQKAERVVEHSQPYLAEAARAQLFRLDYQNARASANIEVGVYAPEISNDERERRAEAASALAAPFQKKWQAVQLSAERLEPSWRHQIVNMLLRPTAGHVAVEPARATGDDKGQQQQASNEHELAALFDPVHYSTLEAMFPTDGKWRRFSERADRNGLIIARVGRAKFNPMLAALWWHEKQSPGWALERVYRKLALNLPARSKGNEHLFTGDYD